MGYGVPCCPTSPSLALADFPLASLTSAFAAFHLPPSSVEQALDSDRAADSGHGRLPVLHSLNDESERVEPVWPGRHSPHSSSKLAPLRDSPFPSDGPAGAAYGLHDSKSNANLIQQQQPQERHARQMMLEGDADGSVQYYPSSDNFFACPDGMCPPAPDTAAH